MSLEVSPDSAEYIDVCVFYIIDGKISFKAINDKYYDVSKWINLSYRRIREIK